MSEGNAPYDPKQPGDLITAESWNNLQCKIQDDIEAKTEEAIEGIERVGQADNSDKLDGKNVDELTQQIIDQVIDEVRSQRGYLKLFKVLPLGEEVIIEHGFDACPLVDVYQLDYFRVVCCEDKDVYPSWATFYLYHSSEGRIRYPAAEGPPRYPRGSIDVQPRDGHEYVFRLEKLLQRYSVEYDDDTTLSNLETRLWRALLGDAFGEFTEEQYCHSVWFDKCCREEKKVGDADLSELYLQFRPRKTINYPGVNLNPFIEMLGQDGSDDDQDRERRIFGLREGFEGPVTSPAPTQVQVTHFDFDTVGLKLLTPPLYPEDQVPPPGAEDNAPELPPPGPLPEEFRNELKVMVLLKC